MDAVKLSIGVISQGNVFLETVGCLIYAINNVSAAGHSYKLNFHKGTYVQQLRNDVVKEAFKENATHLMFVDNDVCFNPDSITALINHKKDIVGGLYNMKEQNPPKTTLKMLDSNGKYIGGQFEVPNKLFKAFAIPTGFMLVRLAAIKDMVHPFDFGRDHDGQLIGEDINFCKRCGEAGLDIWCDPTIKIGHIGQAIY